MSGTSAATFSLIKTHWTEKNEAFLLNLWSVL